MTREIEEMRWIQIENFVIQKTMEIGERDTYLERQKRGEWQKDTEGEIEVESIERMEEERQERKRGFIWLLC